MRAPQVHGHRSVPAGHVVVIGVLGVLQACAGGGGPGETSGMPATSVTVSWTPPATRTDGTPLNNLAGFRIRYGTMPSRFSKVITVTNPGITNYVVEGLTPGTYYFVVTAFDTTGLESSFSDTLSKTIN